MPHHQLAKRQEFLCHIIFNPTWISPLRRRDADCYSSAVNVIALPGLAVLALAFLALGAGALGRPRIVAEAGLPLCAIGTLITLGFLLTGAPPAVLILPVATLALDGLSGFFLLLLLLAGMAICAACLHDSDASTPLIPVALAAAILTLLAADGLTVIFAFVLACLAGGGLALADRGAASRSLGLTVLACMVLVPALGLLAANGWEFPALRADPPEAWRAACLLVLLLAALTLPHAGLAPAQKAASGPGGALLAGGLIPLSLYVLIRVLFDLAGPAPSVWWGLPLLLLGCSTAVLGGRRATDESDIKGVTAWAAIGGFGLAMVGLGLALAARAVDLAPLASLALGAVLLLALTQALFVTLLALAAGAVQQGAGSRRLDRLGGLIHGMPITSACVLAGAACMAALPPSAGFAAWWMLFQALLGAPRIGGMALQVLICGVAVLLALAVALQATAAIRLVGLGFLGRPRSPRAAAAEEAGPATRIGMLALAAAAGTLGIFPGTGLILASPALRVLLGVDLSDRDGIFILAARVGAPGYSGPAIAALLALCFAAVLAVLRRGAATGHRQAPAWEGGFDAPPPWLPFGDPLTQVNAGGFSLLPRRILGWPVLSWRWPGIRDNIAARTPSLRATLGMLGALLILLLLLVAGWEQP